MPPVTRRFLATAALSLLLGLALGVWLLVRRELFGVFPTPHLTSAHAHLVLVGTVMQVIAAVALWMFPLPRRDLPPPPSWPAMAGWWLLAPGTLVRAGAEAARAWSAAAVLPWLVVGGGMAQVAGMVLVLAALRHRIRPVGAGARAAL